jgi:hypothetical protein
MLHFEHAVVLDRQRNPVAPPDLSVYGLTANQSEVPSLSMALPKSSGRARRPIAFVALHARAVELVRRIGLESIGTIKSGYWTFRVPGARPLPIYAAVECAGCGRSLSRRDAHPVHRNHNTLLSRRRLGAQSKVRALQRPRRLEPEAWLCSVCHRAPRLQALNRVVLTICGLFCKFWRRRSQTRPGRKASGRSRCTCRNFIAVEPQCALPCSGTCASGAERTRCTAVEP